MSGIRLHLPLFDRSTIAEGVSRLVPTRNLLYTLAERGWYLSTTSLLLDGMRLLTYRNNVLFSDTTTGEMLLESDYSGYSRHSIVWTPSGFLPIGQSSLVGTVDVNVVNAPVADNQSIWGAYCLDQYDDNRILAGVLLDSPIVLRQGSIVHCSLLVT